MSETRRFPIQAKDCRGQPVRHAISWRVAELFRAQAERNHDQTLERLAERGGLSWMEAAIALAGRPLFGPNTIRPDQQTAQSMLAGAAHALDRIANPKGTSR